VDNDVSSTGPERESGKPGTLLGMTPDTRFRLKSARDLIAVVPYLLGFHPADSMVAVAMTDRRVLFVARQDLPPPEAVDDAARELVAVVQRHNADRVAVIGYGPEPAVTPAARAVAAAMRQAAVTVHDVLRVAEGRYASYLCTDHHCCPAPCPPPDSAVAVAATYAGQVALPGRDDLVGRLAPATGPERRRMVAATGRACARLAETTRDGAESLRRAGRRAVRDGEAAYRAGRGLTDDEVAWLALVLLEPGVRNYAWARTTGQDWRLALWTDVVRRAEPGFVSPAAGLLSLAALRRGQGALAQVALDRAQSDDPTPLPNDPTPLPNDPTPAGQRPGPAG
jgi:hypothetical protein